MTKQKVSETLKEFGLTDEIILNLAIEERLLTAARELQAVLLQKWNISTIESVGVIKALRTELN